MIRHLSHIGLTLGRTFMNPPRRRSEERPARNGAKTLHGIRARADASHRTSRSTHSTRASEERASRRTSTMTPANRSVATDANQPAGSPGRLYRAVDDARPVGPEREDQRAVGGDRDGV